MLTEFTKLECLQGTYSDIFKDVHGFRPRGGSEEEWNSEEWLENEIGRLGVELDEIIKLERIEEEKTILAFENKVDEVINSGAGDRKTALRWLFDAEDDEYKKYDRDYYCYCYGLPYGYFKNEVIG